MRKMNLILVLAVLVPAFFVSAQQNPLKKQTDRSKFNRLKNRGQQTLPKIDLSAEPSAAPSEECDVTEFQLKRKDMQGEVVKLTFDRVIDLKQTGQGYTARLSFESARGTEGVVVLIPEEGLEMFKEMAERFPRSPLRKTVLVEVLGSNVSRAVGTRYSKSKSEGERYSW